MTTDREPQTTPCPRWLHRWAVLTVCATLGLLTLGAVVTTFRVGMTDPIWPTYPWHLLLIDWQEPQPGFLVEHSHRLAGYVVGCCTIVLAVGLWFGQERKWLRGLGAAALLAVIVQGLLGGFRVVLHEWLGQQLSLIHGFFAQIVFGLLVSLAVCTSRSWQQSPADGTASRKLRRWTLVTVAVILGQILLGGFVRHTYSPLGQRGHLLCAFLVVAAVVVQLRQIWEGRDVPRPLKVATVLLANLVVLQVCIGVEAWMSRLVLMSTAGQAIIRTTHFLVGAGVFGAAVTAALHARRPALAHGEPEPHETLAELEVVA